MNAAYNVFVRGVASPVVVLLQREGTGASFRVVTSAPGKTIPTFAAFDPPDALGRVMHQLAVAYGTPLMVVQEDGVPAPDGGELRTTVTAMLEDPEFSNLQKHVAKLAMIVKKTVMAPILNAAPVVPVPTVAPEEAAFLGDVLALTRAVVADDLVDAVKSYARACFDLRPDDGKKFLAPWDKVRGVAKRILDNPRMAASVGRNRGGRPPKAATPTEA